MKNQKISMLAPSLLTCVISALTLSACGEKNVQSSTEQYEINITLDTPQEKCTTGKQVFTSKKDYCAGLANETLNKGCAKAQRKTLFESSKCDGDFDTLSAASLIAVTVEKEVAPAPAPEQAPVKTGEMSLHEQVKDHEAKIAEAGLSAVTTMQAASEYWTSSELTEIYHKKQKGTATQEEISKVVSKFKPLVQNFKTALAEANRARANAAGLMGSLADDVVITKSSSNGKSFTHRSFGLILDQAKTLIEIFDGIVAELEK